VADLEATLGYSFNNRSLLTLALTHPSLEAEDPMARSNERLEFLGDAVLGLVIAEELHESWAMPEGSMTKVRAAVVSEAAIAHVARQIGIGEHLRFGKGEEATGGRDKASILSDALEAVVGAVFLDGGWDAARLLVLRHWRSLLAARVEAPGVGDFKTVLQEVLARRGQVPVYIVSGAGPDHDRVFAAIVHGVVDPGPGVVPAKTTDADRLGAGTGSSKKRAQQDAAREALASLGEGDA